MNSTNKQVEILNELAGILAQSAEAGYGSLSCRFDVDVEEKSVGQEFSFTRRGELVSAFLNDPDWVVMDLVLNLHKEMEAHTAGNWTGFTLTIGDDGKANTHFEYAEK